MALGGDDSSGLEVNLMRSRSSSRLTSLEILGTCFFFSYVDSDLRNKKAINSKNISRISSLNNTHNQVSLLLNPPA